MLQDLVNFRQREEHGHRRSFIETKVQQFSIQYGPHLLYHFPCLGQRDFRIFRPVRPRLGVYRNNVFRQLVHLILSQVSEFIVRIALDQFGLVRQFWRKRVCNITAEGELIEIHLVPVGLEQLTVVGEIVVTLVRGLTIEALYEQTPPAIATPEIYRAVHSFHATLPEPGLALIEQLKCRGLIVDAIEKTHAARGLVVALVYCLTVHERRYASDGLPAVVVKHPAGTFAMAEGMISFGIKYGFDIAIEGSDPVRFVPV